MIEEIVHMFDKMFDNQGRPAYYGKSKVQTILRKDAYTDFCNKCQYRLKKLTSKACIKISHRITPIEDKSFEHRIYCRHVEK